MNYFEKWKKLHLLKQALIAGFVIFSSIFIAYNVNWFYRCSTDINFSLRHELRDYHYAMFFITYAKNINCGVRLSDLELELNMIRESMQSLGHKNYEILNMENAAHKEAFQEYLKKNNLEGDLHG